MGIEIEKGGEHGLVVDKEDRILNIVDDSPLDGFL